MKYQSLVELIECAERLVSEAEGNGDKKRVAAIDHFLHGLLYCLDGKHDEEMSAYENAVKSDPDNSIARKSLAKMLEKKGRNDEAKEHYRIAAVLDAACVENRKKEVELNPTADAYHYFGAALYSAGRLDEAVAAYMKTIELCPDDAIVYYQLAKTLKKQGKNDEAKKYGQIFRDMNSARAQPAKPEAKK
jgi:tetratricopeptide (TPR) repeat protein